MEQLKYALVLQHSCKVYHTTMLFTCFMCGCFVSILVAAGVSLTISTGTMWLVYVGTVKLAFTLNQNFTGCLSFFVVFLFCFVVFCVFFCFRTWFHWGWGVKLSPKIWHCSWYETSRCINYPGYLYFIAFLKKNKLKYLWICSSSLS